MPQGAGATLGAGLVVGGLADEEIGGTLGAVLGACADALGAWLGAGLGAGAWLGTSLPGVGVLLTPGLGLGASDGVLLALGVGEMTGMAGGFDRFNSRIRARMPAARSTAATTMAAATERPTGLLGPAAAGVMRSGAADAIGTCPRTGESPPDGTSGARGSVGTSAARAPLAGSAGPAPGTSGSGLVGTSSASAPGVWSVMMP